MWAKAETRSGRLQVCWYKWGTTALCWYFNRKVVNQIFQLGTFYYILSRNHVSWGKLFLIKSINLYIHQNRTFICFEKNARSKYKWRKVTQWNFDWLMHVQTGNKLAKNTFAKPELLKVKVGAPERPRRPLSRD